MRMTTITSSAGFTIVELMVTLAVAAILMGYALPAFNDFLRQRTLTASANDFVLAVTYARSEAARRGEAVSVVALGADEDNEWGEGFEVVVDSTAEVLRSFDPVEDATFDAEDGLDGEFQLTFNARGMMITGAAGEVALCHPDSVRGRVVDISAVGRPDVEELDCP